MTKCLPWKKPTTCQLLHNVTTDWYNTILRCFFMHLQPCGPLALAFCQMLYLSYWEGEFFSTQHLIHNLGNAESNVVFTEHWPGSPSEQSLNKLFPPCLRSVTDSHPFSSSTLVISWFVSLLLLSFVCHIGFFFWQADLTQSRVMRFLLQRILHKQNN